MRGAAQPRRARQKSKTGLIVLGCASALVVALTIVFVVLFRHASIRQPKVALQTPEASATVSAADTAKNKRLFLQDLGDDDSARAQFFQDYVRSTGERCEGIERAMMRASGSWIITCKPGYIYTFKFDAKGEMTEAKKMN
jgi:hypothetical protein